MHCQQKPKFQNSPNIHFGVELLVNDIEMYENRLYKGHLRSSMGKIKVKKFDPFLKKASN